MVKTMYAFIIIFGLFFFTSQVFWKEKLIEKGVTENNEYLSRNGDNDSLIIIKKVKVLSFKKELDDKSKFYKQYESQCQNWNLTESNIVSILQESRRIDGHEFQYYFSVLPCLFSGEVLINDSIKAKFEINSGSYSIIKYSKGYFYLGYFGKENYFISQPDTQ